MNGTTQQRNEFSVSQHLQIKRGYLLEAMLLLNTGHVLVKQGLLASVQG